MWRKLRWMCLFSSFLPHLVAMASAQDAESCGICHRNHYREWLQSTHSQSWKNSEFQAQLKAVGSPKTCGRCHAPESVWKRVDSAESERSLTTTTERRADYTPELASLLEFRESGQDEGVGCGVCHRVLILWGQGSTSDDFVGPYHVDSGHEGRETPVFKAFQLCGSCHGRDFQEYQPDSLSGVANFHHSGNRAYQFAMGADCAGCHMQTSQEKLVQLSVFKEAPERTVRSHTFDANRFAKLETALELRLDGESTLVIRNASVGHPPQISADLLYRVVVSRLQQGKVAGKHEVDLEEARTWSPGEDLRIALPFSHTGAGFIRVEFFRKMVDGFEKRLFTKTL